MNAKPRLPFGQLLFASVLLLWVLSLVGLWTLPSIVRWSAGLLYVAYDTWLIFYVAVELRHYHSVSVGRSPAVQGRRSVAVLIAARNEVRALPATLDALLGSEDAADEIWVIDDGSTDDTLSMLSTRYGIAPAATGMPARSALHRPLNVLSKPNSGKADSLNHGIGLASSDLVITVDADTILHADAIGAMRRSFSHERSLVAAGGLLIPRCAGGLSGRLFEWFQTFEYVRAFIARVAWMRADALLLVSGAFACYRRDALQSVGGFDPRSWVEDYELIHRLHRHSHDRRLGWRVRVLPDAAAITDAPGTLGAFFKQRRRWFAGFLQTLYHNRDMVGNRTYASVGRLMLPLKVIDTLQPLFGITAFVLLLYFALRGQAVLGPVLVVIGVKLVIDFVFLLWGVAFYNRWSGRTATTRQWTLAALAALTEPFCFQLMRHVGALLGWLAVLTRRVAWLPQRTTTNTNKTTHYTGIAMLLHWSIALCMAVNVGLALSADHLPDAAVRPVIDLHKSIGITALGLVLMRILWRLSHAPPPLSLRYPPWERRLAHLAHGALYLVMLALPLSGWLHDSAWKDAGTHPMLLFGWMEWPRIRAVTTLDPQLKESLHTIFGQWHTWFGYTLYLLVLLHVLGALKHQLVDREPELQRMWPRGK